MAKIKKTNNTKCWQGVEQLKHCWWGCKIIQLLWKTAWKFFIK